MLRLLSIIILASTFGVLAAIAADFEKIDIPDDSYPDFIHIKGGIELGDGDRFLDLIGGSKKVTVVLESPGGNVKDALMIGAEIRLRNFATMVAADKGCYSACALIWVAGNRRYMSPTSEIGFHAAFRDVGGESVVSGMANAEIGSYLTHLGLRVEAIRYFTFAGPNEFLLLSPPDARALGIDIYELDGERTVSPREAPTVDEYARRFVAYSSMASRCQNYFGVSKDDMIAKATVVAEAGQKMVGEEMWIELWMRELEPQKQRFISGRSISECLFLERALRLSGADTTISGPSFDCLKARTKTELTMCREPDLWGPDRVNSAVYNWVMSGINSEQRNSLRKRQREWLRYRDQCGADTACLVAVYDDRTHQFKDIELPN